MSTDAKFNSGFSLKSKTEWQIAYNPDKTACYKPSHLDLHCLHRYLFWSARLKGLPENIYTFFFVFLFVLRFYSQVNPMGSYCACTVYLTTLLLGRLSPLSG